MFLSAFILMSAVTAYGANTCPETNKCSFDTATGTLTVGADWCSLAANSPESLMIPLWATHNGLTQSYSTDVITAVVEPTITVIGNSAFTGCKNLTSITIPNSARSIGSAAFTSCQSLTSITIPNSVASIDALAFSDCISLTTINFERILPPTLGNYCFSGTPDNVEIHVPKSADIAQWVEMLDATDTYDELAPFKDRVTADLEDPLLPAPIEKPDPNPTPSEIVSAVTDTVDGKSQVSMPNFAPKLNASAFDQLVGEELEVTLKCDGYTFVVDTTKLEETSNTRIFYNLDTRVSENDGVISVKTFKGLPTGFKLTIPTEFKAGDVVLVKQIGKAPQTVEVDKDGNVNFNCNGGGVFTIAKK